MKRIFSFLLIFALCTAAFSENACAAGVNAAAAAVINADTGTVLYGVNENRRLSMASTTKIMTALLLCENADLSEAITVTDEMVRVEGSSMGLLAGDTVSYKALLYGMLLPSGNDAANVTAIALGGSLKQFAVMMNRRAAEIGMNNTNFVTPSGLDDEYHYSTAYDMALLAATAMKNEVFKKAAASKSAVVEFGNPPYKRQLYGHNKLLSSYSGANGVKTGYTSKSGKCLVSSAQRGSKRIIAVSLNDSDTLSTHKFLLDKGFRLVDEVTLGLPCGGITLPVVSGAAPEVRLSATEKTVCLSAADKEDLEYKLSLPRFLYAPVKNGTAVGRVDYYIGKQKIATVALKTANNVALKEYNGSLLAELLENLKLLLL